MTKKTPEVVPNPLDTVEAPAAPVVPALPVENKGAERPAVQAAIGVHRTDPFVGEAVNREFTLPDGATVRKDN
jgi:hypothetical protein